MKGKINNLNSILAIYRGKIGRNYNQHLLNLVSDRLKVLKTENSERFQ